LRRRALVKVTTKSPINAVAMSAAPRAVQGKSRATPVKPSIQGRAMAIQAFQGSGTLSRALTWAVKRMGSKSLPGANFQWP
jgi:hypothetical protein